MIEGHILSGKRKVLVIQKKFCMTPKMIQLIQFQELLYVTILESGDAANSFHFTFSII